MLLSRTFPHVAAALVALAVLTNPAAVGAQGHVHAASAQSPDPVPQGGDAAEVAATLRDLFAAAERGDLDALDTLYAGDSLTVIEGAGMNRTWAEYRDHHLAPELKVMKDFQYRPDDIAVRVVGDLAWATFRYGLKAEMNGRAADVVGRGTAILERRGPRWVVRHTHTSGRARRPTDPPLSQAGRQ